MNALQSLRYIAAICIFFHHLNYGGCSMFAAGGDMGVAFFIVLSGFVLSEGYCKRMAERKIAFGQFMSRRIARLYPLHAATLGAFCLLAAFGLWRFGGALPLLTNAMMLQSWIPRPLYYFSGNAVSWCLADFMFFYALFPWLARQLAGHPRRFIAVWAACALAWFVVLPFIPSELVTPVAYILPLPRLLDFVLGMLLWRLCRAASVRAVMQKSWIVGLMQVVSLCLCVAACKLWAIIPECYAVAMWWWVPLSLVIASFAVGNDSAHKGVVGSLLCFKGAAFLGAISFPFYMTHWLVIKTWHHYAAATASMAPWVAFLIVFAAATATALLLMPLTRRR